MMSLENLPPDLFPKAVVRHDDLRYLLQNLQRRQHCAILGASNMGKSTLLNSLATPQGRILCHTPNEPQNQEPIVVFVDCLEAANSEHALYAVLMRRIVEEFDNSRLQADNISKSTSVGTANLAEELHQLHTNLLHEESDIAIRSAFASGIRRLMQTIPNRIIIILDEFDDTFRALPPWLFRHLRAVSNAHTNVQFVIATTHRLTELRNDDETYEFREMFHLATRTLHLLNDEDSGRMLAYLDQRHADRLKVDVGLQVTALAGGHPGLLERLYGVLLQKQTEQQTGQAGGSLTVISPNDPIRMDDDPLHARSLYLDTPDLEELYQEPSIQKECERLWQELEESERVVLLELIQNPANFEQSHHHEAWLSLVDKDILSAEEDSSLFSPLFAHFIARTYSNQSTTSAKPTPNPTTGIVCDLETEQIWVDGEEITWLLGSEHQRRLILLLYSKAGAVCRYDEIAETIWGVGEGVTPGAIRELANRTRKKLPDPDLIVTVPGEGYRLVVQ